MNVEKKPVIFEVDLLTWNWQYDDCNGSGWSFRVGKPWLRIQEFDTPRQMLGYRSVQTKGDYGLHVMAKRWRIQRDGILFVSSTDADRTVNNRFLWLDGIRIKHVEIAEGGWLSSARFEDSFSLEVQQSKGEEDGNVANWFDYRGERID